MKLLEGKKVADKILDKIKKDIKKSQRKPSLAVVLIGNDKASELYVKIKKEEAKKVRIDFFLFRFKENSSEKKVIEKIRNLNRDRKISGIIVQLPLPKKINTQKIISSVSSLKDVDGFSANGKNSKSVLKPVFPMAIIKLLESSGQKIDNKKAIVISNSKLFGEVMSKALREKKMKSGYILKKEIKNNLAKIKRADILVSAVGSRGIIKGEMIKSGAIVIDGGIAKEKNKVFGDVDFKSVKNIAGFLTPVPGGVGPVTVACLLKNVYLASKL